MKETRGSRPTAKDDLSLFLFVLFVFQPVGKALSFLDNSEI